MFKSDPTNEAIVNRIESFLSTQEEGSLISHEVLTSIAGLDVTENRHLLASARKRAEKRLKCLFVSVRGIGIKREHIDNTPQFGSSVLRQIRRKAGRGSARISEAAKSNRMSPSARQHSVLQQTKLNFIRDTATERRKRQETPSNADPYAAKKQAGL